MATTHRVVPNDLPTLERMIELPLLESCDNCGACCMITCVPPFVVINGVHEGVLRGVPNQLLDEIMPDWHIRLSIPERPCSWLDTETKTCRHYEYRPQACRDFEINSKSCHAIRDYMDIRHV